MRLQRKKRRWRKKSDSSCHAGDAHCHRYVRWSSDENEKMQKGSFGEKKEAGSGVDVGIEMAECGVVYDVADCQIMRDDHLHYWRGCWQHLQARCRRVGPY